MKSEDSRNPKLFFPWILIGFDSLLIQIILLREAISIFYGNEISLGLVFCSWMLWIGLGSVSGSLILRKDEYNIRVIGIYFFILGIILPLTFIFFRLLRVFLGYTPGELLGIGDILIFSFIVPSILCTLLGFGFTLCCKVNEDEQGIRISNRTMNVYIFEAFGAAAAGILFHFVLAGRVDDFSIVLLLGIVNISMFYPYRFSLKRGLILSTISLVFLYFILFYPFNLGEKLRHTLYQSLWKGQTLISTNDTKYGNLTVLKKDEQYTLLENNSIFITYPDAESAEEKVHFAMVQHQNPKTILILGGSALESLGEILKYDVDQIHYVELDPETINTLERYFPDYSRKALEDRRVQIHLSDPRTYIGSVKDKFDMVILNIPDPVNIQINRLYTKEFFKKVSRVLNPGGVFSFSISASENFLTTDEARLLKCLENTVSSVFLNTIIIPGRTCHFISSQDRGYLTQSPEFILKRLADRGIQTIYVSPYFLPFRLSADRISYFNSLLREQKEVSLNTDLKPVCYFYDMVLWSSKMKSKTKSVFMKISTIKFKIIVMAIFILFIIIKILPGKKKIYIHLIQLYFLGLSLLSMEIILLIMFQVVIGYLYSYLGILISLFMIGLAVGSMFIHRRRLNYSIGTKAITKFLIRYVILITIYLVTFKFLVLWESNPLPDYLVIIIFFVIAYFSGFLGGSIFVLASKMYIRSKQESGRSYLSPSGIVYGFDLFGSCLGALITSSILIPVYGLEKSLSILVILMIMTLSLNLKIRD